jgi:GntR family transcriptional regulator, transcriptional repressor for pyruvate dehydrogenase complex
MGDALRKFDTIPRKHAADAIYEQLAGAILRGDFKVGEALPPERELAASFGVSRTVARQAVHRIAEIGLVRVRQGGATIVQDFTRSSDLRLVELRYRLGGTSDAGKRDFAERRMLEGFALVLLASYRASNETIETLLAKVEDFAARGGLEEEAPALELEIWTGLAEATGNQLYIAQVSWFQRQAQERGVEPIRSNIPAAARVAFYTELFHRLLQGRDAAMFYLDTLRPFVLGAPPRR